MSTNHAIRRIGKKLQDQSSDIVQAGLPDRVLALLRQLHARDAGDHPSLQDRPPPYKH
jgi:hypothetical protein